MSGNGTSVSPALPYQDVLGMLLFCVLSTATCCMFLCVNATLLFTLRSRRTFRETPCYVLLCNLLLADALQLAQSQALYLLAAARIRLALSVCGAVAMFADLTAVVSPLTLVLMSLERYVAVCRPLRHAAVVTVRATEAAVVTVWTFSSVNIFVRVVVLCEFPFEDVQMKVFCGKENLLLDPVSDLYDKVFTCLVFLAAGASVTFSFVGVTVAARSASTSEASARKARNTLLLHMLQLGLSLCSTLHSPVLVAVMKVLDRVTLVHMQRVIFFTFIILPRCMSALIYGVRDQNVRGVLVLNLCCQWKRSRVSRHDFKN